MSASSANRIRARFKLNYSGFELDVDLDLAGRGITALFGPSGSGKTSCLRAIAGLERSTPGVMAYVAVNEEVWQDDAKGVSVPVHQRALGYVFQDANLFTHLSVAQNLAYGLTRVPAAQRRVSLDRAVALLGIGHLMDRQPGTLSGGERQRVAIARALATSPRILLMDEPLAALDAQRKAEILPYLEQLHHELDIPVLYVSHALDEVARLADHLVLLEAGRVVASGPTAELMTRLDLSLAHGDTAGAVIHANISSHEPVYHLSVADFAGGRLCVPQQTMAVGQPLRIRVQARDVSLTLEPQTGTSILNILPVTVVALSNDSPGQVMVRLDAGGTPLLARITQKSVASLGLVAGRTVYAQVKGVAILGP
ncbi:MAG: molybdenum ABC transporter ATP-binding protein [Rhodoferax sp.]|uniref:molybdenum ABC transporter ATP-binding protein n=1 Tax=Rhodoferax sp. TaxID=50421 RepID=UPI00271BF5FF|nr:molybdenum ABC transporter ATP-binding protein [Rhodoferax sp.]MDO8451152.1 molybdenum ABC transporter ATP-binding protein [Rhodoferax sp.]